MSNLLIVAAAAAVVGLVAARMVFPATPNARHPVSAVAAVTTPEPGPTPSAPATTAAPSPIDIPGPDAREYAVALHELRGLPTDVQPGTELEVWVAWDDAYVEGPGVHKLVGSVTIARFIQPVTPEGPVTVVLSVPLKSMRRLLYGDVYGALTVALPTS